jgi:hypothetical protein
VISDSRDFSGNNFTCSSRKSKKSYKDSTNYVQKKAYNYFFNKMRPLYPSKFEYEGGGVVDDSVDYPVENNEIYY